MRLQECDIVTVSVMNVEGLCFWIQAYQEEHEVLVTKVNSPITEEALQTQKGETHFII